MDRLDPSIFKKMFGVDCLTFEEIVGKITPFCGLEMQLRQGTAPALRYPSQLG
jgi:hypothetical protein